MTDEVLAAMTTEAIRDHLTQIDAELRRREAGAVDVVWWAVGPEAPGPTPEEYAAAGFEVMTFGDLLRAPRPNKERRGERTMTEPVNSFEGYARFMLNGERDTALTLDLVRRLVPEDVATLFAILRGRFELYQLAHLLHLVSEMVTKRAEATPEYLRAVKAQGLREEEPE